jgi:predicted Zn-dependent protease
MFLIKNKITYLSVITILCFAFSATSFAQISLPEKFADAQQELQVKRVDNPLSITQISTQELMIGNEILTQKTLYTIDKAYATKLMAYNDEVIKLALPQASGKNLELQLVKADIFSPQFKLYASSNRKKAIEYERPAFYWGQVSGDDKSLVAISITKDEISGMIVYAGDTYNLGKIKNQDMHILYREKDVKDKPALACYTDDDSMTMEGPSTSGLVATGPDNCVKMYVEVDNTIYQDKGTVAATTDYITGVFNQVAIMYANEAINFTLNELVIWNTPDPYTGPSSGNYLTQFRDNINGNYNGDLAHLVGYGGGGGVAYVNVLCNSFYGVGYSGINSTYQNVPTYSWTVNVITHEIGHNLGSPHTHSCVWNGNNTPIDGCGPAAGYSDGCDGPVPNAGTVMSYCHLLGGVGIDPSLGFGPQPGDLIRNNVYNATCLTACGDGCPNVGDTCNDDDPCTTGDVINAACNCVGNYVDNDGDGFCIGEDPDDNDPCNPNSNNDGCTADCEENTVSLTIVLDNYPGETTWTIASESGSIVASGGSYGSQANGSTVIVDNCLVDGCYTFTINDSYGDGICCAYGLGSYGLSSGGVTLASGGAFGSVESTDFCLGEDGGGECSYVTIDNNNFESGWGIWNDGGSDCRRSASDQAYTDSGTYCVRLRDNTNTSTATTDNLNLAGYEEISVSFTYYPRSMDNSNEDFWLQISTNGGSSYTTVEEWNRGDEFENNIREYDDVTIEGPFTSQTRLRFRCDASGNYDFIYLDDIEIEGCLSPAGAPEVMNTITSSAVEDFKVYPNPVSIAENIIVEYGSSDKPVDLFIYSNTGELIRKINIKDASSGVEKISAENLTNGSYLIRMESDTGTVTKPFIVIQ